MLDMLLLDIFQNLDISQYCHVTTSFIFDSQWISIQNSAISGGSVLTVKLWILACDSVTVLLSLLLMNGPGLIDWLGGDGGSVETSNNTSLSLHLLTDQSGGSPRSCESLLSWQVSNSWLAGVSPHDLCQCQTGLPGLCSPSLLLKHQTS